MPEHPSVVIVKPVETDTFRTFIFFLPELVAVSVFGALVVPSGTLPKSSGPLSCSLLAAPSGDDATSSSDDCASAGRASVPIRSRSAKVKAVIDRTIDLQRM